jgi:hypothetical protein
VVTPSPTLPPTAQVIVVTNTPTPGAAATRTPLPPSRLPTTGGPTLPWPFILLIAGTMLLFNGIGFAAMRHIRME